MRIVIGYDGSECSEDAARNLRIAGLPPDGEALVVSVADMWPILPDPENEEAEPSLTPSEAHAWEEQLVAAERRLPEAVQKARQYALERLEEVRAHLAPAVELVQRTLPGWNVSSRAIADSPYWGLTKMADQWKADMVVVGSHGRSALGRMFLGSVSLNVVNYAHCTVRVYRCGIPPRDGAMRLAVGYDGSRSSEAAVQAVIQRHWPEGSEVCLIAVHEEARSATFFGLHRHPEHDDHPAEHEAWLRSRLDRAATALRATGLGVEIRVPEGDPKYLLAEESDKWKADCLFVGARGLGGFKPLLLGSVATSMVSRAHCTVEVIRVPREESGD